MSIIAISHLTFCYEGCFDPIFEDVSLTLDTDWKLGLIGRNGRGKTTLLKLLLGELPSCGSIRSSVAFSYFPQEVAEPQRATLEVVQQASGAAPLWQIRRELSLLGMEQGTLERPYSTLSGGEQIKAILAALFLRENNFLLIDEPTNHLDLAAREAVSAYLRDKSGFILVSHDRAFLDGCIDHVLSINRLDIELQRGNFSSWQTNKEMRDGFERAKNDKLKAQVQKLSEAAARTSGWSDQVESTKIGTRNSGLRPDRGFIGHKSAKMMKRSKSIQARRQKAVEEKEGLLRNIDLAQQLAIHPLPYHKENLLSLDGVTVCYGGQPVCAPVDLTVRRGERIALRGKNGSGKTSLLKLILGEQIPHSGAVVLGSGLILSHVPQDTSFLRGGLREFARERGLDESLFKTILRKLDLSRVQFEKELENFSGGQKKKVLLAASLCERAHLYLWDEPLNYVDVLSRVQLEQLLLEHRPTMLFVEHDRRFCETVATRTIQL